MSETCNCHMCQEFAEGRTTDEVLGIAAPSPVIQPMTIGEAEALFGPPDNWDPVT